MRRPLVAATIIAALGAGTIIGAAFAQRNDRVEGAKAADEPQVRGEAAHRYAVERIVQQLEGVDIFDTARSYLELLPNQQFKKPDGSLAPASAGLVRGEITDVVPRFASKKPAGGDAETDTRTSYDDPEAIVRVVQLQVQVIEATGKPQGEKVVKIGLPVPPDTDLATFREGLVGREIITPLNLGFFPEDSALWRAARNDTLIAFVADDGTTTFPFLEAPPGWPAPPTTAQEILRAAQSTVTPQPIRLP